MCTLWNIYSFNVCYDINIWNISCHCNRTEKQNFLVLHCCYWCYLMKAEPDYKTLTIKKIRKFCFVCIYEEKRDIYYISRNLNLVNSILRENSQSNTMNIISLWWNSSMFVISMVSNTSGNKFWWKTDARMSLLNQGRNEIRFNNSDGKCLLENWVEEVGTYNFHTVSSNTRW